MKHNIGAPVTNYSSCRKDWHGDACLEISLDPVSTTDGLLVIVSMVDVTTRREAEVGAQLLHTVVEGAQDYGIFMLDPAGNVLTWNEGAARLKGYSASEIIGQHFSRFFTPEDIAAGHPAKELRIAEAEGKFEEEGWRVRRDGSRFFANVLITALRDNNGDNSGALRGFSKLKREGHHRAQGSRGTAPEKREGFASAGGRNAANSLDRACFGRDRLLQSPVVGVYRLIVS